MTPPTQPPAPSPEQENRIRALAVKHAEGLIHIRNGVVQWRITQALTEQAADFAKERAETRSPRIYTRCPACHNDTLTINDDKHLLCTWLACPDPTLIDTITEIFPKEWERAQRDLTAARIALAAMEAKLAAIKQGADADAADLEKMRDGTKMTRSSLVEIIVYQQEDLKELRVKLSAMEEKARETEKTVAGYAKLIDGDKWLDNAKEIELLRAQLASTQAKLDEAEARADERNQVTMEMAGIISGLQLREIALAAALKQAREALGEAKSAMIRYEMDVDDPPTPSHRKLMQSIDSALSTHPDSALLGRVVEVLKEANIRLEWYLKNKTIGGDKHVHDRITQLLADLGGQQP